VSGGRIVGPAGHGARAARDIGFVFQELANEPTTSTVDVATARSRPSQRLVPRKTR
jgi:hypothetical protein